MLAKMQIRQVFAFGANNCGQLGLPEKKSHPKPTVVPVAIEEVSAIACGAHHTVLLSAGMCIFRACLVLSLVLTYIALCPASGEVFSTGSNEFGQLGLASESLAVESLGFVLVDSLRGRLVCVFFSRS